LYYHDGGYGYGALFHQKNLVLHGYVIKVWNALGKANNGVTAG
jgi:hypothetical protein